MEVYGFVLAKESIEPGDFVVHGVEVNELLYTEEKNIITHAISEMSKIYKMDNIYMLTDRDKVTEEEIRDERSIFSHNNILLPHVATDVTTFGYAAMYIAKKFEDGILCMSSSDSIPEDLVALKQIINKSIKLAFDRDKMIIINTGEGPAMDGLLGTKEKKIFVWKATVFLDTVSDLLPQTYEALEKIGQCIEEDNENAVRELYKEVPMVSLDLGLFTRATNVMEYFIEFDEEGNMVNSIL